MAAPFTVLRISPRLRVGAWIWWVGGCVGGGSATCARDGEEDWLVVGYLNTRHNCFWRRRVAGFYLAPKFFAGGTDFRRKLEAPAYVAVPPA